MVKKDSNSIELIKEISNSDLNDPVKEQVLETTINNLNGGEKGLFEKIFGTRNPEIYVALFIGVAIVIAGIICTFIFNKSEETVKELWNIFIPALTLVLGYVLGNKK